MNVLAVIFVLALCGWMFGSFFNIHETAVAMGVMASFIIVGIITWDDIVKSKSAWATLVWYGGIIGLSSALAKLKFFVWLAETMKGSLEFGESGMVAFYVILFASGGAYVAAMVPVFCTVGLVMGAPVDLLAMALLFSNSYGGAVTHYGGAAAPVIFGLGYVDMKTWWIVGGVIAFLSYAVHMTIGVLWWKMIGLG